MWYYVYGWKRTSKGNSATYRPECVAGCANNLVTLSIYYVSKLNHIQFPATNISEHVFTGSALHYLVVLHPAEVNIYDSFHELTHKHPPTRLIDSVYVPLPQQHTHVPHHQGLWFCYLTLIKEPVFHARKQAPRPEVELIKH